MTKHIIVVPYNPDWPHLFTAEAKEIHNALLDNCTALHHVGSTSVPGLSAKPIIDIIVVVKNLETTIASLESLGFKYKGEYNIPFRYYFSRSLDVAANLHVYEEGHPEIELNLCFRDYLRTHKEALEEYAQLKENLLKNSASFEKNNSLFTGYNLGKDAFIRKALQAAHFTKWRITKCTHYVEQETAKSFSNSPEWTFTHNDHVHFMLYKGVEIMGHAHMELLPHQKAIFKNVCTMHPDHRLPFLEFCKTWLQKQGFTCST
jgi:GrpB-like predicted nucleotidyltransferase (UPF0157 family)